MKQRHRSDTERAVLAALIDVPEPQWCGRFLGYYSKSLSSRVDRAYKLAHPDRRNRPSYRNIERALATLIALGEVEQKSVGLDPRSTERYYRLTASGRAAAEKL